MDLILYHMITIKFSQAAFGALCFVHQFFFTQIFIAASAIFHSLDILSDKPFVSLNLTPIVANTQEKNVNFCLLNRDNRRPQWNTPKSGASVHNDSLSIMPTSSAFSQHLQKDISVS